MLPQHASNLNGFLLRTALSSLGLWFATGLIDGLHIDGPATLVLAAVLLGACNALVRPLLILLTLPATMLSLGLFLLVINAVVLWLVSAMLPGFTLSGFWSAFFGAMIVGLTGWVGSMLFR
jgi:putative membrane protein